MPSSRITAPAEFDPVLQGGGACGALMRAVAWHSNALGAPSDWPQELRTVVAIALGSTQPMLIVWGREQITLYNDGYAAMCGSRHPAALGRPFRDLWFDIWERVDPIISAAFQGISTSMDDIEFIMHRNGYPEETHFAFSYTPVRDSSGAVLGMFCACAETTAQVTLQRRLAKEREQLRQIFERALGAVAILSGPDHVFTFANNDYRMLVGHRELVGRTVAEALPEVVEQGYVKLLDTVLETGEAYTGRRVETELRRTPGAAAEKRLVDFVYHPIGGPDGRAEGIFVQAIDMTERVSSEHQQHLLNLELAHRMKNQLALVQAIAGQTLRSATDLGEARESLNQRLAVLARAQDMLLAGRRGAEQRREAAGGAGDAGDGRERVGPLALDQETGRAYWHDTLVPLTLTEFQIVYRLASDAGRDVRYREIYNLVHGDGFYAGSGEDGFRTNVRTFVKRIRRKFLDLDEGFCEIENYPGFGYRWRASGS